MRRTTADFEEAKRQEILKFHNSLQSMQAKVDETNALLLAKEREFAQKTIEEAFAFVEETASIHVQDSEKIDKLSAEVEELKSLLESERKRANESEKKCTEVFENKRLKLEETINRENELQEYLNRLEEKLTNIESENKVLRQQALNSTQNTKLQAAPSNSNKYITKSKKGNDGNTVTREKFTWSSWMDDVFIQAMLQEQDKGNRVDGIFTSLAYTNMVDELTKKVNKDINKNHLKNRLKTLKEHFSQCYDIFRGISLSGFAWNPETKLFEAEDEVWERLIAEKPEAAKWKTKQVSNYNELLELFAKDRATSAAVETAKEKRNQMRTNDEPIIEAIDEIDQLLSTNDIILENFNESTFTTPSQMKPTKETTSECKKRKLENDTFAAMIIKSVDNVADALREGTKVFERSRPHVYSTREIYNELELMGVGAELIEDAYLFLIKNREHAEAVFGCPLPMRMSILTKLMNTSH